MVLNCKGSEGKKDGICPQVTAQNATTCGKGGTRAWMGDKRKGVRK